MLGDADRRGFRRYLAFHVSAPPFDGHRPAYFFRFDFVLDVLRATAARTSALNARASTFSFSRMSIARLTFPSRLELKSFAGSSKARPSRTSTSRPTCKTHRCR